MTTGRKRRCGWLGQCQNSGVQSYICLFLSSRSIANSEIWMFRFGCSEVSAKLGGFCLHPVSKKLRTSSTNCCRYSHAVNHYDGEYILGSLLSPNRIITNFAISLQALNITKLDILDTFPTIKVATAVRSFYSIIQFPCT